MESGQTHFRLGNQGGQLGNEIRWFEYGMGSTIAVKGLLPRSMQSVHFHDKRKYFIAD
jgi:hypothetical protein